MLSVHVQLLSKCLTEHQRVAHAWPQRMLLVMLLQALQTKH